MCGLHILVQLWAWERLPSIAPQCPNVRDSDTPYGTRWLMGDSNKPLGESMDFYRSRLDSLYNEFVWEPYPKYVLATLPEICLRGHESWRAVVPLICFQIVEWHQPDRAMRQFGMEQHIPSAPSQPENIHGITLRGKVEENWSTIFDPLIELWNNRLQYVCTRNLQIVPMSANHDYMKWYRKHTRRWITRKGTVRGYSFAALEVIQYLASPEGHSAQHPEFAFDAIRREAEFIFMLLKEEDRLLQARVTTNMPTQEPPPVDVNINMPENRVERQGLQRRRVREEEEHYNIPQFPARQEGN
ncbi:hypothetical protein RJT34_11650 [Clitoria ternatea]|uniref:Aminotransferase-like plant mobile domain-containing protein n=1 Tax=Clitoria ternatea TaxID=43366 RepID=A0AAN9PK86_CLITE